MRSRCHVALEADDEAEFSTWIVKFSVNKLLLNARTAHAGRVRVELLGLDRRPLPGRKLDNCDPIDGNLAGHVVTWQGDDRMFTGEPTPLGFRFNMTHAQLFRLRFC